LGDAGVEVEALAGVSAAQPAAEILSETEGRVEGALLDIVIMKDPLF
jgi:hypothetical protein